MAPPSPAHREASAREARASRGRGLREPGTRGAVYVEFLIAFLPFFIFFLCLWQASIVYYTKLFVDHAAFAAARAAAVIIAENPNRVDPNGGPSSVNTLSQSRDDYVRTAAELALAPLIMDETIAAVDVKYPPADKPGGDDVDRSPPPKFPGMTTTSVSLVRVRIEAFMQCKIAFANAIMCPPRTLLELGVKTAFHMFILPVRSEAVFPFQGASYTYKNDDDQGGHSGSNALLSNWGGMCFVAGTPVDTEGGLRPIEQVRAGDLVMSRAEVNGPPSLERVSRTFITPGQSLVEVALRESDPIRATPGHLFATAERGWIAAERLLPGEALVSEDGAPLHVASVTPLEAKETVYNFEVENSHTYFVGRAGAWVHNPTGGQGCMAALPSVPALSGLGGMPGSSGGAPSGSGGGGSPSGSGGGGSPGGGGGGGGPSRSGGGSGTSSGGGGPAGGGTSGAGGGGSSSGGSSSSSSSSSGGTRRNPGQTCEDSVLDSLQATMHGTCDQPNSSCSNSAIRPRNQPTTPCSEIQRRLAIRQGCVAARQNIQTTCFGGTPDAAHASAIQQAQNAVNNCAALAATNCAPGHPMSGL